MIIITDYCFVILSFQTATLLWPFKVIISKKLTNSTVTAVKYICFIVCRHSKVAAGGKRKWRPHPYARLSTMSYTCRQMQCNKNWYTDHLLSSYPYMYISVKYQKLIKTLTNDFWDIPKCHRKRNVWVIKSKRATLYELNETPEGTEN